VIPLLFAEVTLQAAAWWVWRSMGREPEGLKEAHRTVLCLGDSNTFGSGAGGEDKSYPAVLDQLLRTLETPDWHVINAGWPGQNSAEILHGAPSLLQKYRPHYVCVLAGINNRWNHALFDQPPPSLEDATVESERGWRWKLRILRVLQLLRSGSPSSELPPETDLRETRSTAAKRREKSRLGFLPSPMTLEVMLREIPALAKPALPPQDEEAPELDHEDPLRRQLERVEELIKLPDLHGAGKLLDSILPDLRRRNDLRIGSWSMRLILKLGRIEDVVAEGEFYRQIHGPNPKLADPMVRALRRLNRIPQAREWADFAVAFQPKGQESPRPYIIRSDVRRNQGDYEGHAWDAIRAYLLGWSEQEFHKTLRQCATNRPQALEHVMQEIEALKLEESAWQYLADSLHRLLGQAAGGSLQQATGKLQKDLQHLVALVRNSGATPVLLTYPNYDLPTEVSATLRAAAAQMNAALVDVTPSFRGPPKSELFSADLNHPNARGYRLIAQQVAQKLQSLEQRE
jgi:lysophospholipase L1-like esterase